MLLTCPLAGSTVTEVAMPTGPVAVICGHEKGLPFYAEYSTESIRYAKQ